MHRRSHASGCCAPRTHRHRHHRRDIERLEPEVVQGRTHALLHLQPQREHGPVATTHLEGRTTRRRGGADHRGDWHAAGRVHSRWAQVGLFERPLGGQRLARAHSRRSRGGLGGRQATHVRLREDHSSGRPAGQQDTCSSTQIEAGSRTSGACRFTGTIRGRSRATELRISAPRLSPDGKQIAFFSYRSGDRKIWVVPSDGGPAVQLTTGEGDGLFTPHGLLTTETSRSPPAGPEEATSL